MTLRQVTSIELPDAVPATLTSSPPSLEVVDPRRLLVDESYQRALSRHSIRLIRETVEEWNSQAFKPPLVAMVEGAYHVIDGACIR